MIEKVHYAHNVPTVNLEGDNMINIAAREARANFGELMDTAQREPISIEKHGRPVAVLMSAAEYEKIQHERLQIKVTTGFNQLDNGEYSKRSVRDILNNAKKIHEKIQTLSTS